MMARVNITQEVKRIVDYEMPVYEGVLAGSHMVMRCYELQDGSLIDAVHMAPWVPTGEWSFAREIPGVKVGALGGWQSE